MQTLNHIANKLEVESVELMNHYLRGELNKQIAEILELIKVDESSLQVAINRMEELTANLSMNFESTRILSKHNSTSKRE